MRFNKSKRMYDNKKGWRGDSLRHSLASRGIKTGQKTYIDSGNLSDKLLVFLEKKMEPMTVNKISEETALSRQTVDKHLEELKKNGKIKSIESRSRVYWKFIDKNSKK